MKKWFWGKFSTQNEKIPKFKIGSAHIHILRNNPAKFHNNPMDSVGGDADNRFRTYVRMYCPTDGSISGLEDGFYSICTSS